MNNISLSFSANQTKDKALVVLPELTKKDLMQLAYDICVNKVFTSFHIEAKERLEYLPKVFLVLNFLDKTKLDHKIIDNIGMVYEYYNEGIKYLSTGKYPLFYSCSFLNKKYNDELEKLIKFISSLDQIKNNNSNNSEDIQKLIVKYNTSRNASTIN